MMRSCSCLLHLSGPSLLDCLARDAGTVSWLQRAVLPSCPLCDQAGCIVVWLLLFVAGRGRGGTYHLCVWPQVPLVLQPAADLGGRLTEQTLELMVCAVTTSSLLGCPSLWQCSASSLELDELINEPDESGIATRSIIPVSFNRRPCPSSAAEAQVT